MPPVTSGRGYEIGEFADPGGEVGRLERQASLFAAREDAALAAVEFPNQGRLLDVGCGPGFVAARLASSRPAVRITGVDAAPALVAQARQRIEAHVGEATALEFADATFDGAYTRFVLRHLDRPGDALRSMVRVVRPAGRVVAIDGDDGALVIEPEPDGFRRALAARHRGVIARGADPFVGRRLVGMFREAGMRDVRSDAFFVHTGMCATGDIASLLVPWISPISPDLLSPTDAELAARALKAWAQAPGAFAMLGVVVVGGTRA